MPRLKGDLRNWFSSPVPAKRKSEQTDEKAVDTDLCKKVKVKSEYKESEQQVKQDVP